MTFSNLITGNANTFDTGVSEWSVTNGTNKRLLGLAPYSRYFAGSQAGVDGNLMIVFSDGVGVTEVLSPAVDVTPGTSYGFASHVSTSLYSAIRAGYVEASIRWYDSGGVEVSTSVSTSVELTNSSDPEISGAGWYMVAVAGECPELAESGRGVLEFSSTTLGSGTAVDDRWAVYDPIFTDWSFYDGVFEYGVYSSLPEFMRIDDELVDVVDRPLRRYVSVLTQRLASVSALAESFDHIRPSDTVDGVGQSSALTDPDLIDPGGLGWLAALTGVSLFSGAVNFTPWSAFVSGSIDTWTEWEEDIVPGGVGADTDWAALEAFGVGFTDPIQTYRDQIRTGFTGINAGRPDVIVEFIRTLLNSADPDSESVILRKRDRDNPFLVELAIDSDVDPDPGGLLVETILNLGLPAGVTAEVTSTTTPIAHSSVTRYFDGDDLAVGSGIAGGAAEWPRQGFTNVEGGPNCAVLLTDLPNQDDGGYGGIIAEAPMVQGLALFSGYRVSAETATNVALDLVGDFDIFVGISNVVTPTDASGGGTESGTAARIIASGNNWSLHMTKDEKLTFSFTGTGVGTETVTSTVSHPFSQHSETSIIWLRVEKTGETIRFYASHDLYNDWVLDGKQLGTDLSLTAGNGVMVSSGASSYVKLLEDADPGTNAYAMSLTCVVHRCMVFTGAISAGAWSESADGNYDYSGAVLDINFKTDPTTIYDTSFTESGTSGLTVTINDNSGDLGSKAHVMLLSQHGNTFYFGKSPDQFAPANPDNAGDTLTALVADGTYDWKMSYIDTSNDSVIAQTVTSVVAAGGTGITWDADDYGDRCITQLEVVLTSSGVFDSGNDYAMFLPSTLDLSTGSTVDTAAAVISGADSATLGPTTWELDRAWDTTDEYLPSQLVDRNFIHTQDGQICIPNMHPLSINSHRSYVIVYRNDGANSDTPVFTQRDSNTNGVIFFHITTSARFVANDGTSTDTVTFNLGSEGRIGEWNLLVFRFDPAAGVSMFVNDAEKAFVEHTLTEELDVLTSDKILLGSATQKTEGAIASFMTFNRYLTDAECVALAGELGIV